MTVIQSQWNKDKKQVDWLVMDGVRMRVAYSKGHAILLRDALKRRDVNYDDKTIVSRSDRWFMTY